MRRRRKATEENTRLYGDLEKREAKIRRLVDSNIVGIMIPDLGGQIIDANDAFLAWSDTAATICLGPPAMDGHDAAEWRDRDAGTVAEMKTRECQPFEKEYFRKDGSRVPVLVGGAAFE